MAVIDLAIGGLGCATISAGTGTGLIVLCSVWVLLYSLSLAPIGEPHSELLIHRFLIASKSPASEHSRSLR